LFYTVLNKDALLWQLMYRTPEQNSIFRKAATTVVDTIQPDASLRPLRQSYKGTTVNYLATVLFMYITTVSLF